MDDSDTATIELTRPEARGVINALSEYHVEATGGDETRALEARDFLQREFDFKDEHFPADESSSGAFGDVFDADGDHEIQFSRVEATEVGAALGDYEADADPSEAETIADIRGRIEDAFDLDGERTT